MAKPILLSAEKADVAETDFGRLTWYASRKLANSEDMTVGCCLLKPGKSNPIHSHPNCSEVLVVLQGHIMHTMDENGGEAEMNVGDTITVPANFKHQARNIGDEDAVLLIAFSSADREVKGE